MASAKKGIEVKLIFFHNKPSNLTHFLNSRPPNTEQDKVTGQEETESLSVIRNLIISGTEYTQKLVNMLLGQEFW